MSPQPAAAPLNSLHSSLTQACAAFAAATLPSPTAPSKRSRIAADSEVIEISPLSAAKPPSSAAFGTGRPVPNAALLGGFAALSGLISLESLAAAIRERFEGAVGEGNVAAAQAAHDWVTDELRELSGAAAG